ncbi:hypothetical protein EG329_002499 [Mollisiaceae sp. DMI_Dod_QoI]|nr:hypothetical protein EG329_002499 [Helotiales sp. DMI_Dod_QoI]
MSEPVVHHSGLSTTFKGIRHDISSPENEIWQFRGIKYADIPSRFRQSTLHENFPPVYEVTAYGPKCPQTIFPVRMEDALIGVPPHIASHVADIFDELDCLHLNITVPAGIKAGDDLPVMVYVHGGGGFSGANSDWWCDGGSIVKRSVEIGKPVIMIAINYRLGVFGYIGSEELGAVNGKENIANFGRLLLSQSSLQWIHTNIAPFGGSPINITIYGESHGSLAISAQMHSSRDFPPFFTRTILQSQILGGPLLSDPLPLSAANTHYEATKTALNITSAKELEVAPWQELLAAFQNADLRKGFGHVPTMDNVFLAENWREGLKNKVSGKGMELLIGCTGNESSVLKMVLCSAPASDAKPPTSSLIAAWSTILPPQKVAEIFDVYGIQPDAEGEVAADILLQIAEDVCWYRDQEAFAQQAREAGMKVMEYTFEQRQPFGGPFKGVPAHSLDLAYLHGDPAIFSSCENPEQEMKAQRDVQDHWIGFAHGEIGKRLSGEEVSVFGPDGENKEVSKEVFLSEVRRGKKWNVWEGIGHAGMEGVLMLSMMHLLGVLGQGVAEKEKEVEEGK